MTAYAPELKVFGKVDDEFRDRLFEENKTSPWRSRAHGRHPVIHDDDVMTRQFAGEFD
jgi:hypothetical protein